MSSSDFDDESSLDSTVLTSEEDDDDETDDDLDDDDDDDSEVARSDLEGGFSSDASDFLETPIRTRPPPRARARGGTAVAKPIRRGGRMRPSSESSDPGSPIIKPRAGKARPRQKAIVSSSSENEDANLEAKPGPSGLQAQAGAGGSTSSDDNETECCSICLLKLKEQEIGVPDGCEHRYCAECLIEWSENVSTCPIDRISMRRIQIWQLGSKVRVHKVKKKTPAELAPQDVEGNYFDDTCFCEFCGSGENAHTLLLCDGCDLGYHMVCLEPPLSRIPQGRWFCPTCQKAGIGGAPRPIVRTPRMPTPPRFDEFRDTDDSFVVDDTDMDESWRGEMEASYVVPRTVETERIQKRVQQIRRKKAQSKRKTTKRITRRKTSSPKKKRTSSSKTASSSKKKKSTTRRKKTSSSRKTKGKEGKGKGKGKGKSSQRRQTDSMEDKAEGTAPLSLFGKKNDLDFFGDESLYFPENPQPSTSSGSRPLNPEMSHSRAAKIFKMSQKATPKTPETSSSSSTMDLLGSIMASQAATLNTHGSHTVSPKFKEIYTKPEGIEQAPLEKCKSPPISRPPYRKTSSSNEITIASPKEALSKLAKIKDHASKSIRSLSMSIKEEKNPHEASGDSKDLTRIVSKRPSISLFERKDAVENKKIKLEEESVGFDPAKRSYEPSVSYPSTSSSFSLASKLSPSSSSPSSSSSSSCLSVPSSSFEKKTQKLTEISLMVKKFLKPFFERGTITRSDYKYILKKGVEKIFASGSSQLRPEKVEALVKSYVKGITVSY